jgi:hypothetical protein
MLASIHLPQFGFYLGALLVSVGLIKSWDLRSLAAESLRLRRLPALERIYQAEMSPAAVALPPLPQQSSLIA